MFELEDIMASLMQKEVTITQESFFAYLDDALRGNPDLAEIITVQGKSIMWRALIVGATKDREQLLEKERQAAAAVMLRLGGAAGSKLIEGHD